ncbi:Cai-1 autoinducer sensor kinase/phosphatase cqss [Plakobranchus ocellatus]|uniref:Cai-1 autoinducer sensor kinase/phosphatase cqss n=1 Tax=Plakobranchus ocellatus TaxID=259542 RepID=A0AAV4BYB7_9GAST|nr:Cai-1 autoinducer sensor kinase/phosphatase cqss [Plakobranchus ocellatus]
MRISISSLRSEEYDICEKHRRHKENCCGVETCDVTEYLTHKAKYRAARAENKKDAELNTACLKDIKVSADLQKVIRLPRIDEFKTCIFTHRLVAFNETISELGKNGKDTAVLWHEAISGRRNEDIASAFHAYNSQCGWITVWAKIKNWTLFTMMLFIVNCPRYEVKEMHLKAI